jgi:hypothetical protein
VLISTSVLTPSEPEAISVNSLINENPGRKMDVPTDPKLGQETSRKAINLEFRVNNTTTSAPLYVSRIIT